MISLKKNGLLPAYLRGAGLAMCAIAAGAGVYEAKAAAPQAAAQAPTVARAVGTIKSISGTTVTLSTDAGTEVTVQVQDGAKLVRVAPGQKDLKDAAPIQLQDLQVGDRVIVRGKFGDDGKTLLAAGVIAMSKTDIAAKQAQERQDWQRNGVGGLVESIDAAAGTIQVTTPALGDKKIVTVHFTKDTVVRRYASDSIKFDDAKPAPMEQIKSGDQLRARGKRNADGTELAADEIVAGTFHNLAGIISSVDAGASSLTLQDLTTKKTFTVKITPESQLRKLPAPMAMRIAARLKGTPGDAAAPAPAAGGAAPAGAPATRPADGSGAPGATGAGGSGRPAGGGDLQQSILRLPPATLADLAKGDAVMIVATEGTSGGVVTAITLLGGVEQILQASPKGGASTILSPWSLGGAPGGDAGTP
jgi:Domain of unknown function (DUF5666)